MCDIMEQHKVQHCNVEIDDFIHGIHIISQSCAHMQGSNFIGYVSSNFHNNMYKMEGISTSTKNTTY